MLIQMLTLSEAAEGSVGLREEIDGAGREHKGLPLGGEGSFINYTSFRALTITCQ